jgi:hypothetical protein
MLRIEALRPQSGLPPTYRGRLFKGMGCAVLLMMPLFIGAPGAVRAQENTCCVDQGVGNPGCDTPSCESCVCAYDPNCCTDTWDAACAAEAANPAVCAPVCPCGICGDGVINLGELCDEGAANGGVSCCTASCLIRSANDVCRAQVADPTATSSCDIAEICSGSGVCVGGPNDGGACTAAFDCGVPPGAGKCTVGCPADAVEPAGTLCRSSANVCDPAEFCDGTSNRCTADIHGVAATKPKVMVKKLTAPPGSGGLKFAGEFVLSPALLAALDPASTGAEVLVLDSTATTVVDAVIPSGTYDPSTKTGWKVNSSGTQWAYSNPIGIAGITKLKIANKSSATTPGRVTFKASAKNGTYAVPVGNIPLVAALAADTPAGNCALATFAGPACAFNSSGATLICK